GAVRAAKAGRGQPGGTGMDEADLVGRVLNGDRDAYAPLVEHYTPSVYELCRALVGRREEACDLAQEALLRALRDLASLQKPSRFGPWLLGIARNLCRDWHKDPENKQVPFTDLRARGPEEGGQDMDTPAARGEPASEWGELWAAVEGLPEECREVIWLYYT